MNWWWSLVCFASVVAAPWLLYALHRLCLWLEDAGYMYYRRKKPGGGGGGGLSSLVELQKALEPTTKYVVETKEQRVRLREDEQGAGE